MRGKPNDDRIPAHIEAVGAQAKGQTPGLLSGLAHGLWPGGTADRRPESFALQLLRRWGPSSPTPVFLPCSCAAGRCAVCN
jgi:hypothetical protein